MELSHVHLAVQVFWTSSIKFWTFDLNSSDHMCLLRFDKYLIVQIFIINHLKITSFQGNIDLEHTPTLQHLVVQPSKVCVTYSHHFNLWFIFFQHTFFRDH